MSQLLTVMLKQMLNNTMKVRQLHAATVDTILISKSSPVITALTAEGDAFAEQVAAIRKADKSKLSAVGPPTAGQVVAILEALVDADVGAQSRAAVRDLLHRIQPPEGVATHGLLNKADLEAEYDYIRIEKTAVPDTLKLIMAMNKSPSRALILRAFESLGAQVKRGVAPAGWMEEELATWLEAVETK